MYVYRWTALCCLRNFVSCCCSLMCHHPPMLVWFWSDTLTSNPNPYFYHHSTTPPSTSSPHPFLTVQCLSRWYSLLGHTEFQFWIMEHSYALTPDKDWRKIPKILHLILSLWKTFHQKYSSPFFSLPFSSVFTFSAFPPLHVHGPLPSTPSYSCSC